MLAVASHWNGVTGAASTKQPESQELKQGAGECRCTRRSSARSSRARFSRRMSGASRRSGTAAASTSAVSPPRGLAGRAGTRSHSGLATQVDQKGDRRGDALPDMAFTWQARSAPPRCLLRRACVRARMQADGHHAPLYSATLPCSTACLFDRARPPGRAGSRRHARRRLRARARARCSARREPGAPAQNQTYDHHNSFDNHFTSAREHVPMTHPLAPRAA